ncbi:MAG: hypothetical protein ACFFE6_07080 [Candidatus Thorarchaeota archaeon]
MRRTWCRGFDLNTRHTSKRDLFSQVHQYLDLVMRVGPNIIIGIIGLLVISQTVLFIPMVHTRSGSHTLTSSVTFTKSIDCESGRVVIVQFSAEYAAIEFFIVHSDFYDLAGLPVVSLCQYHVVARSASHQFTSDRSGTWYLVFANSPQEQQVDYEWTDYSLQEWNTSQIMNWTIILGAGIVLSMIAFRFARERYLRTS